MTPYLFHKRKSETLLNNTLLDFVPLSSGSRIPLLTKVFYYLPSQPSIPEKEKNNKFHFSFKLSVTNTL